LRNAALANVGSAMVWSLNSDADATMMARWLATPGLEAQDLKRLSSYQTYARLILDGAPSTAMSVETRALPAEVPDAEAQERYVLERSRRLYYRPSPEVDAELTRRLGGGDSDPQSRPRQRR
jgi:hypothetical protein